MLISRERHKFQVSGVLLLLTNLFAVFRTMKQLSSGKYLGVNSFEYRFDGIILTQNRYESVSSEWHFHENSYFTFILRGGCVENRKKTKIECFPGMLLFYSNQEHHQNEKYVEGSRHFSIEMEENWFRRMAINRSGFEGRFVIRNQKVNESLLKIIPELQNWNNETQLTIEMLVAEMLGNFSNVNSEYSTAPNWLREIKDLLHDSPYKKFSLTELARFASVHPVTISKLFPRFFGTTIGEYVRKIKLEKSFALLAKKHIPIETIALQCGFSDHAHFSRVFKMHKGITPSQYRQFIFS